jgi:hypothetical protein
MIRLSVSTKYVSFLLLLSLLSLGLSATRTTAQSNRRVIELEDNGQALTNPGMGWMFYYYSHGRGTLEADRDAAAAVQEFPGLSTVYLRVPWRYLEPRQDQYNWPLLDGPAQRWIEAGKQVAIRITASESWLKYGTPQWVKEQGAEGEFVNLDVRSWQPDYTDSTFRHHLKDLLEDVARRYASNPDVAFVDLGTFGPGGNGATDALPPHSERRAIRQQLKMYRNLFPDTLLTISNQVDDKEPPHQHTKYAKQGGFTVRMVQPDPDNWTHKRLPDSFANRRPVILEHGHGGPAKGQGASDHAERLVEAIEEYRPSYVGVRHPGTFHSEHSEAIQNVNRRLGYRLQLRKISFPTSVGITEEFTVKTAWSNAGVAPCYPGGYLSLTLKNDNGGIVAVMTDPTFNVRQLNPGPNGNIPVTNHTSTMVANRATKLKLGDHFLPKQTTNTYDVYVSVGKLDGTPKIELPLDHGDGHMRYRVGKIKLTD